MHETFVTLWLQVMQPLANVHETKWTPHVKREVWRSCSYNSCGLTFKNIELHLNRPFFLPDVSRPARSWKCPANLSKHRKNALNLCAKSKCDACCTQTWTIYELWFDFPRRLHRGIIRYHFRHGSDIAMLLSNHWSIHRRRRRNFIRQWHSNSRCSLA